MDVFEGQHRGTKFIWGLENDKGAWHTYFDVVINSFDGRERGNDFIGVHHNNVQNTGQLKGKKRNKL